MKNIYISLCCVSVLFCNSCSLNTPEENFQFTTLQVVSADFPESFVLNETFDIDVVVIRPNSCTFFEGFEVISPELTIRDVSAVGTILTNNVCNPFVEEVTSTFTFRVDHTDPYLFRFYSGDDDQGNAIFLEYNVPVNQ